MSEKVLKNLMPENSEEDTAVIRALQKQKIEKHKPNANHELIKQNEELRREIRERDNLLYSISQNLSDPLIIIHGLLHLAKEGIENHNSIRSLHDSMESAIKKWHKTVNEIHALSRNARSEIKVNKIEWSKIVDSSLYKLEIMDENNVINKFLQLETDIPLYSDEYRLQVVMEILLSNAIQFRDKTREMLVGIEIVNTHQEALIIIKDNGIGISNEMLSKIFDAFYIGSGASNGSQLGLYLARLIVEKLGGKIEVHSILGQGTTVTIIVPNLLPFV